MASSPGDPDTTARASTPRAVEIDGIRGWASLVVLLYHAFREMLREVVPVVGHPALAPIFAAELAVSAFFVLSGDALSLGFFHSGRLAAIDRLVVRRYFRLTVPILMSCLVTYLIMKTGIDRHAEASQLLGRQAWLGSFLHFSPSIYECLKYSLLKVYVAPSGDLAYNPFLWTMSVEMAGSMLVFLLCYLWPRLKHPERVCIALVIGLTLIGSFFSLFFAGVLFSHWRRRGMLDRFLADRPHQVIALFAVVLCTALYVAFGRDAPDGVLRRLMIPTIAMVLVFCAYTQGRLRAFFSGYVSRFLGVISFPLYLIQFQVLISLMSWLVVRDHAEKGQFDRSALIGFAFITVVVSIGAAWCFSRIERVVLKAIDRYVLRVLI